MRQLSIKELGDLSGCIVVGKSNVVVEKIVFDSRKTFVPDCSLFVAIKTSNNNGHDYIKALYQKGIRAFIVEKEANVTYSNYPDAGFIESDHSLSCLQSIATHLRQKFEFPVIGITGSNGKTVVKEWLAKLLESTYKIGRSPRSFNSQIGVPLSICMLADNIDYALIEAGISQPNEMLKLSQCVQANYGVLTNIGTAHQENFISSEEKLNEKLDLFVTAHTIFCHDNDDVINAIQKRYPKANLLTCGDVQHASLRLLQANKLKGGSQLLVSWQNHKFELNIPFNDAISIENSLLSALVALSLGVTIEALQSAMGDLQPIAMRLEQKEAINNCLLIDDTYNSDLTSLELALDFLNQMGAKRGLSKTLILSDIFESGITHEQLIKRIKSLVKEKGIQRFIGIGPVLYEAMQGKDAFLNTNDFIKTIKSNSFTNEAILVKGSRSFSFERISNLLEQRRHKTVLEINLNALGENIQAFRSKLNPETKVLAMVKAFSYGSGSFEIANYLQHQKVDYLGVAFADEGIELRDAGITLPIIVMNPELSSFPLMLDNDLEPEIYSFEVFKAYQKAVQRQGLTRVPIHIKIDTGMNRLGFLPSEIYQLIEQLKGSSTFVLSSVFSHLAGTDDNKHDDFTNQQISVFNEVCEVLKNEIGVVFSRHILNSAGIERFPNAQFDMVRLGIGMYGVSSVNSASLQQVITLKSYISQLKYIEAGSTIGYGRIGLAEKDMTIAVVPIGYADGYNRRLSNGVGQVFINGSLASIVGNVCMDMCMVDVSYINVNEGDEVELFGANYTIAQLATTLQTIPYEILTSVSRRVKRVYIME